ncbi:MAG: GntR family transcriptional regulator, partial [Desulfobacterales bacterium]
MNSNHVFEEFGLPRSLVEDIANNLSDAIIEGKIHPGQQIIETDLQRALGVSRAPIREALLKLEGQGLVIMIPRKGSFVRSITPRFIQESFIMRAWLEGLGARLAVQNIGKSECDQMEKILSDMAKLAREKDFKGYFYRHWDFHRFFYKASQNNLLINRIETIRRESLWLSYSITYFEKNHGLS